MWSPNHMFLLPLFLLFAFNCSLFYHNSHVTGISNHREKKSQLIIISDDCKQFCQQQHQRCPTMDEYWLDSCQKIIPFVKSISWYFAAHSGEYISLLKCPFPCNHACIPTLMLLSLVQLLSLLLCFFPFIYASVHALMLLYLMSYSFLALILLPILLCFYLCCYASISAIMLLNLLWYFSISSCCTPITTLVFLFLFDVPISAVVFSPDTMHQFLHWCIHTCIDAFITALMFLSLN